MQETLVIAAKYANARGCTFAGRSSKKMLEKSQGDKATSPME